MIAVGSLIFVLPLHLDLRDPALEDSDDDMLDARADETPGSDLTPELAIWVSPRSMRRTSRQTGVYEEPGRTKAEAMVID